jgi:hypothetical protein
MSADVNPENRVTILRSCYKCQIIDVPQGELCNYEMVHLTIFSPYISSLLYMVA